MDQVPLKKVRGFLTDFDVEKRQLNSLYILTQALLCVYLGGRGEQVFQENPSQTCIPLYDIVYSDIFTCYVHVFALAQVPDFAPEQAASHRFDHVGDAWSTPNPAAVERSRRARLV